MIKDECDFAFWKQTFFFVFINHFVIQMKYILNI